MQGTVQPILGIPVLLLLVYVLLNNVLIILGMYLSHRTIIRELVRQDRGTTTLLDGIRQLDNSIRQLSSIQRLLPPAEETQYPPIITGR